MGEGDEIFKLGAEGNVRLYTHKKRAFENSTYKVLSLLFSDYRYYL